MYLKGRMMHPKEEANMINEFRRYIIKKWDSFSDIENQLDKNKRLLIRQCMAEEGLELTPDEVDKIVALIISIKQSITPLDLIWDIEN
tara:strand:+ start:288 stop:551 length:264 start_codon:yes stop_codon:yes gene_type:complete